MKLAVSVLVLAMAFTACAKQRVVTQPDVPPLAPPTPPPRVVTPPEPEEPPPTAKPADAPARKQMPPPARVEPPPKPEEKPPAKPEVAPPSQEAQPVKTLQTPLPASQGEVTKQIKDLLGKAERDLYAVNFKSLNADARGQWDQARRFVAQARQALADQNFVLAQRLAEKAATIAGVLLGR